jgi:protein PhnA
MSMELTDELIHRANGVCELCESPKGLVALKLSGAPSGVDGHVVMCGDCSGQIEGSHELTPTHWFCLQESIWSQEPAVQVAGYRILKRLAGTSWAEDLLQQVYLDEETLAWADSEEIDTEAVEVVDSNGAPLTDGDSVTLIRGLDVKGANFTAKRGTLVKNIRLTDDPTHIEGRVNGTSIYLKTCFLKKANSAV